MPQFNAGEIVGEFGATTPVSIAVSGTLSAMISWPIRYPVGHFSRLDMKSLAMSLG